MKNLILLLVAIPLLAQQQVTPATESVYIMSGGNLAAVCTSLSTSSDSRRANISVSISAATNANPVVFTSTAHGFDINGMHPSVTISGGTGNWAAVNGTFVATIVDANTFSIPVNSTAFGAVAGTLTFTTTAPRSIVPEWQVHIFKYDVSNNIVWSGWLGGTDAMNHKCSDYNSTTTAVQ